MERLNFQSRFDGRRLDEYIYALRMPRLWAGKIAWWVQKRVGKRGGGSESAMEFRDGVGFPAWYMQVVGRKRWFGVCHDCNGCNEDLQLFEAVHEDSWFRTAEGS